MKPSALIVSTIVFLMAQLCMVRAQSSEIGLKPLSQHDPNRKVFFTVRFQEEGSVDGARWSTAVEARYAPMPSWDGVRTFGAVPMAMMDHTRRPTAVSCDSGSCIAGWGQRSIFPVHQLIRRLVTHDTSNSRPYVTIIVAGTED
jgi:hypothetical protein